MNRLILMNLCKSQRVLSLLLLVGFTSCEMIIPVDIPEHKPQLVVNAVLNPDEPFTVHISKSLSIIDRAELPPIENAVVEIYENNNLIKVLPHLSDGFYSVEDFFPQEGTEYKVIAKAPPFDSVYAKTRIPDLVKTNEPQLKDSAKKSDYEILASINFQIHDEPGKNNFYEVAIISAMGYFIYPSIEDPSIEYTYGSEGLIFSDKSFNGNVKNIELLFSSYTLNDRGFGEDTLLVDEPYVFLVVSSVNEEYFLYRQSSQKQAENRGNPFAEPVQVFGNITNGFGIFAGKKSNYHLLIKR
jgi:hypothetical protein